MFDYTLVCFRAVLAVVKTWSQFLVFDYTIKSRGDVVVVVKLLRLRLLHRVWLHKSVLQGGTFCGKITLSVVAYSQLIMWADGLYNLSDYDRLGVYYVLFADDDILFMYCDLIWGFSLPVFHKYVNKCPNVLLNVVQRIIKVGDDLRKLWTFSFTLYLRMISESHHFHSNKVHLPEKYQTTRSIS